MRTSRSAQNGEFVEKFKSTINLSACRQLNSCSCVSGLDSAPLSFLHVCVTSYSHEKDNLGTMTSHSCELKGPIIKLTMTSWDG